jgi:hypothetical protein
MALTKITSTNIQAGAIESSSLETSGAAAGTYGSASQIPVLSVNAQGIVYAISETAVAGVSNFTYDSGTEELTISTADGGSFTADVSSLASQTYVDTALANLIDSAPGALDTLNELAAAIGDDANFAATVTNSLATKVDKINITGATVGSSTQIPVITYNAQGQITSTTTTAVAGIDSVTFTNGTLTIAAGDGTNYTTDFDARYFTETEANANFLGINAKAADADLFDGLNSTQFLRSDTSGTYSGGVLTFTGGDPLQFDLASTASTTDQSAIRWHIDSVIKAHVGLSGDANRVTDGSISGDFCIKTNNPSNKVLISSGGTLANTLVVTSTGIGIGTTSPSKKLDIRGGDVTIYGGVDGYNADSEEVRLWLGNNNAHVGAMFNYGLFFDPGNSAGKAMMIRQSTGYVGINDITPSYHLDVNGTIRATGDVISDSDRRLKSEIKPITNAVDTVKALSGKSYIKDDKPNIGLIAQEVEEVMPFMVHTASDEIGTKSVNYQNMVALLIEAVKEQQEQIDELKRMLESK